jgi:hypothetical protein
LVVREPARPEEGSCRTPSEDLRVYSLGRGGEWRVIGVGLYRVWRAGA